MQLVRALALFLEESVSALVGFEAATQVIVNRFDGFVLLSQVPITASRSCARVYPKRAIAIPAETELHSHERNLALAIAVPHEDIMRESSLVKRTFVSKKLYQLQQSSALRAFWEEVGRGVAHINGLSFYQC